jgi:hypothetical protein
MTSSIPTATPSSSKSDDGLLMFIGPDRAGKLLEIGFVAAIEAMLGTSGEAARQRCGAPATKH